MPEKYPSWREGTGKFDPEQPFEFADALDKYQAVYWARVRAFSTTAVKPLKVGRIYKGTEIEIDCYVTERIRELYQAGKLAVDDYVLVQFVDGDPNKPLAVEKAYKSW